MKIYLDTNVFCRPFDDLEQERIFKEAVAASRIFLWVEARLVLLFVSETVLAELSLIDNIYKKDAIERILLNLPLAGIGNKPESIKLADALFAQDIIGDYLDILHIASAAIGEAEYFLTCDDEILQKRILLEEFLKKKGFSLKIENPYPFVKNMEVELNG